MNIVLESLAKYQQRSRTKPCHYFLPFPTHFLGYLLSLLVACTHLRIPFALISAGQKVDKKGKRCCKTQKKLLSPLFRVSPQEIANGENFFVSRMLILGGREGESMVDILSPPPPRKKGRKVSTIATRIPFSQTMATAGNKKMTDST